MLGTTGIETLEILKGITDNVKPKLLVVIDALATRSLERISSTIQISDTGIVPGAGVGNKRQEISQNTLGVPVIAIGIPTVVELATIVPAEELGDNNMIVTPKEIDDLIEKMKDIVARGINFAV